LLDKFQLKLSELAHRPVDSTRDLTSLTSEQRREQESARLGDLLAEAMVSRLVRVSLLRGPRVHGKESFRVKIINDSPLILNGLAIGESRHETDDPPSVLAGLSLPPLKSLTVPATADVVHQLRLKEGMRVVAADLSGL
jgi:hypothetical protein